MDIEGSVEDPANMKIKVIDFTLFDIGSKAYTEFDVEPEIILPVYDKYPEYINKKYGLIHSHNTFGTFFSGTDTSTLLEQAIIHNFFVSLIINNKYDKIAKISYKGKKEVVETFYNRIGKVLFPYNRRTEEEVVYIIECDVNYETPVSQDVELLEQISVIERKQEEKRKIKQASSISSIHPINDFWKDGEFDYSHGTYNKHSGISKLGTGPGAKVKRYGKQADMFPEETVKAAQKAIEKKCENFVKRLICIDYIGELTEKMTLEEAREERNEVHKDTLKHEYVDAVINLCDDTFDEVFLKEIGANWADNNQFQKFRNILSSNFKKLLNVNIPIELEVFEILDLKLKELDEERREDLGVI
jgi:hypothetical protein